MPIRVTLARCARAVAVLASLAALAPGCEREPAPQPAPPKAVTAPVRPAPSPAPAGKREVEAAGDVFKTEAGSLRVVPIGHGTLRLEHAGQQIYVDPHDVSKLEGAPKADLVLITDIHQDHHDPKALAAVRTADTVVVAPPALSKELPGATFMKNGERRTIAGVAVEALPMYNLKRGPKPGEVFHPKGRGNGYLLSLGGKRVYVAGDTECTPEMKALKDIDIAFVPMNLPYTMPPEEAAECVAAFRPKVVYPYHFRGSNLGGFEAALADVPGVEVRIRDWYPAAAGP